MKKFRNHQGENKVELLKRKDREGEMEAKRNGARNGTKQKETVTHMEKHAPQC